MTRDRSDRLAARVARVIVAGVFVVEGIRAVVAGYRDVARTFRYAYREARARVEEEELGGGDER